MLMDNAPVKRTPWPTTGFVTLKQILGEHGGPIPVSASRWWLGVKKGEFPHPLKVGGRTVWRVSDIDDLVAGLDRQASAAPRPRRLPPPLRRRAMQVEAQK